MSDIANYDISVSIDAGLKSLRKFQKAANRFDKGRETALKTQIVLLQKMKNLQAQVSNPAFTPRRSQPIQQRTDFVGPQIDNNTKNYLKRQAQERYRAEQSITKEKQRQAKLEAANASSLRKAKETVMNSALMTELEANSAQKAAQSRIRGRLAAAKTAKEVRSIVAQERASLRLAKKKSFLMSRMESSSKEFAGNMVSAFALAAGGVFITQTGQDLESVSNTMLAVSKDAEQAGENLEFVREQAYRLGLDLRDSSKNFAKMVSARGDMSLEDTKEAFKGVSEMSTLLGLSSEASSRAINALQQMMSKGVVSAEELKLQMGEVLPNAIQIMAKSAGEAGLTVNGTVKEMMDLQQAGGLISAKVLPVFAKNMQKAARSNGGLDKALQSNRIAMQRMMFATRDAAKTIFDSGWAEGLSILFNSVADTIRENEVLFTEFGKIMGKVFKGLAWLIEDVISPIFSAFGSILKIVNDAMDTFGDWIALALVPLVKFSPILGRIIKHFGGLKKVMLSVASLAKRMFLPFYLGLGILEEIAEFFSPSGKKTLIGMNIDDIKDPFQKWIDSLDKVLKKVGEVLSIPMDTSVVGSTKSVLPYSHEAFNKPDTNKQPVFVLQGDVVMDGNSVGRQIMQSEAAKNALRLQAGYGTRTNR